MAKCGITNVAGGGGIGSDQLSVTKEYILSGKTYVGADTDDEIGTGIMIDNKITANQSLNAGGSFYIKKGYHAQDFTVIANSLASQTSGTAIPSHVLNGETFWANGNKSSGSMNVQSILSFSCAPYSASQLIFTWQNPSFGPFSGVIIIGKTGGYPANINDGTRYYKGFGNNTSGGGVSSVLLNGFGVNITYYFRAFSYCTVNGEEWTSVTTRITNIIIQQVTQVFTSSTTWTVPSGIYKIEVFSVGGGGSGGTGTTSSNNYGGGGGGGGYTITTTASVTPGQQLNVIIGTSTLYRDGSNTYINEIPSSLALGGKKGNGGYTGGGFEGNGGNGGSGGGGSCFYYKGSGGSYPAGNGGSDGSNGTGSAGGGFRGTGQNTTTRSFGEVTGTPYSGGGGGGGSGQTANSNRGFGGFYGGGNGQDVFQGGSGGTPNSGGGGGGGMIYTSNSDRDGKIGGSGICIIRYVSS